MAENGYDKKKDVRTLLARAFACDSLLHVLLYQFKIK